VDLRPKGLLSAWKKQTTAMDFSREFSVEVKVDLDDHAYSSALPSGPTVGLNLQLKTPFTGS
jgi:hypothetical protein